MNLVLRRVGIICVIAMLIFVMSPRTVLAKHKHTWGSPYYSTTKYVKKNPFDTKTCAVKVVYNKHQCLGCGVIEEYEYSREQMTHKMKKGICIYCGYGYAK